MREIRLAAAPQEPYIVPVLAAGTSADGLPYYTMPFVRGESLRTRLAQGPVPLAEAAGILRDVSNALEYAHSRGTVHRDIEPENVLLSGRTAVVTDFGIAEALQASKTQSPDGPAGAATLTHAGSSLGTPAYVAPEQAVGDEVDHRADLYAWGAMAYALLAGRHPFAGKSTAPQLVAAHLTEAPPPLGRATGASAAAAPLAALIMRCLAKDPAARPATAAAVLAALVDRRRLPRGRPRHRARPRRRRGGADEPRAVARRLHRSGEPGRRGPEAHGAPGGEPTRRFARARGGATPRGARGGRRAADATRRWLPGDAAPGGRWHGRRAGFTTAAGAATSARGAASSTGSRAEASRRRRSSASTAGSWSARSPYSPTTGGSRPAASV